MNIDDYLDKYDLHNSYHYVVNTVGWDDGWRSGFQIRLEALVHSIGKDKSVQLSEKSWKQIQRYLTGSATPSSVINNWVSAAGVSFDYLFTGIPSQNRDVELERSIINQVIDRLEQILTRTAGTEVSITEDILKDCQARMNWIDQASEEKALKSVTSLNIHSSTAVSDHVLEKVMESLEVYLSEAGIDQVNPAAYRKLALYISKKVSSDDAGSDNVIDLSQYRDELALAL